MNRKPDLVIITGAGGEIGRAFAEKLAIEKEAFGKEEGRVGNKFLMQTMNRKQFYRYQIFEKDILR